MTNTTIAPPEHLPATTTKPAVRSRKGRSNVSASPTLATQGATFKRPESKRVEAKRTTPKSKVVTRAKLVSYPQTRTHARAHRVETAVFQALLFVFVAVTAYGVSSIAGQVAVEKSRREELSARERTKSLILQETALKSNIVALTRPDKIDEWARANSFEYSGAPTLAPTSAAEIPPKPSSELVALR